MTGKEIYKQSELKCCHYNDEYSQITCLECLYKAIDAAIAAEREACAKLMEDVFTECDTLNLLHGAARIRARSTP